MHKNILVRNCLTNSPTSAPPDFLSIQGHFFSRLELKPTTDFKNI